MIYNPNCKRCPLHLSAASVCVGSDPRGSKAVGLPLVVGEAPGAYEDRYRKPFIGASGKMLRQAIKEVGLEVAYTNVVKCRPPGNRDPRENEIEQCAPYYLKRELQYLGPPALLAVGKFACEYLTGQSYSENRNKIAYTRSIGPATDDIPVWTIYHPSYILRQRSKYDAWVDSIFSFKILVQGG